MRTPVSIDDELYQRALELAESAMDKADLVREAIKVFVRVQAGKRLAALGGRSPAVKRLHDTGCGGVDAMLLASTLLASDALLGTDDLELRALAIRLDVACSPTRH